jgi:serine/threonine protein phosphatase PrpC
VGCYTINTLIYNGVKMVLKVIASINCPKPGADFSEDVFGNTEKAAWILDGTSPVNPETRLLPGKSDALWYAKKLSENFNTEVLIGKVTNPKIFLESCLNRICVDFAKAAGKNPEEIEVFDHPSAAGLIVIEDPKSRSLKFVGLGDCRAIISFGDGSISCTTPTSEDENIKRADLVKAGRYDQAARQAARQTMNTLPGTWTLSLNPKASEHANIESFKIPRNAHSVFVLLMSDGFDRLHTVFNQDTRTTMQHALDAKNGLEKQLDKLRGLENEHQSHYKSWGLTKPYDDASALLVSFTPE